MDDKGAGGTVSENGKYAKLAVEVISLFLTGDMYRGEGSCVKLHGIQYFSSHDDPVSFAQFSKEGPVSADSEYHLIEYSIAIVAFAGVRQ